MRTIITLFLLISFRGASAQPGTVDTTFNSRLVPGFGNVRCVLALPDGNAMIGGTFTSYDDEYTGQIARLLPNGALDGNFMSGAGFDGPVNCLLQQADGQILVGGAFDTYDGVPRPVLARLNADGTIDAAFQPDVADLQGVRHAVVLPSGRILVSGYNSDPPFIALRRLLSDGSMDTDFTAPPDIYPSTFIVLTDDRTLVGEGTQTPPFHCLTSLYADGSVDTTFISRPFGMVGLSHALVKVINERPDGAYIVGGHFESYDGATRKGLVRVLPNGALDTDYDPDDATWTTLPLPWAEVSTILTSEDDGFMIPKFGLVSRLHEDGELDDTFHRAAAPQFGDPRQALITGSARQPDGRIVVAGSFDDIDSTGNPGHRAVA